MSNQIVKAGYRKKMVETFYNPYEFYKLYNLAAIENNTFQFSDEFMDYLKRKILSLINRTLSGQTQRGVHVELHHDFVCT